MQMYFKTWKYVPISEVFIYSFMWAYMYTFFFSVGIFGEFAPPPPPYQKAGYATVSVCVYTQKWY